ncbi:RNA 2',3'-cyclic phosphodiesterase [Candidatus Micrarchaeota archaeon]|nr:RNA 2',3'-cyclic phosphodiesterase [Candidatus Micrarchaeota archaeon]
MRCFLALEIDDALRQRLADVQSEIRQTRVSATYPAKKQLHATLAFFGELDPNEVREKAELLHAVHHKAFDARLFGLGAFPKPDHIRVVWTGFDKGKKDVIALQQRLADALGYRNDQPFHPHVTLARVKSAQNKERLQAWLAQNAETTFPEFAVRFVTLYESRLQATGPAYTALERTELQ